MWQILKGILSLGNKNYCRQNVVQLLDINDELNYEDDVDGFNSGAVVASNRQSKILKQMKVVIAGTEGNLDLSHIKSSLVKLGEIMQEVTKDTPGNSMTVSDEWTLFVSRITLMHDSWYDNKYQTAPRNPFVQEMYSLFMLHMCLRCKRRWKMIMEPPTKEELELNPDMMLPPIFCSFSDFTGSADWFVVYDKVEPVNKPISEWNPLEVYKALQGLMLSRTMGGYNFSSRESQDAFLGYREALLDRVAVIMMFEIEGSPVQLAETRPTWFKPYRKITVNDMAESRIGAVDHKIISRKIREEQNNRTREVIEQMKADDLLDDSVAKITSTMLTTEDRVLEIQENYEKSRLQDMERELREVDKALEQLTLQKNLLQPPSNEDLDAFAGCVDYTTLDYEDDQEEMKALELKMNSIQLVKTKLREKMSLRTDTKLEKQKQTLSNFFDQSNQKTLETSMATIEFAKAMMLLVDSVMSWQLPIGKIDTVPKYSELFVATYDKLFTIVCDCALRANRATFLKDAQQWIVSSRIQPCEREQYRHFYASGASFSSLAVCQSVREPNAIILKHYQEKSLESMLGETKHQYHQDTLNYATWWTLGQLLEGINLDSSLLMWEFEMDFLNLARDAMIPSPTIVRLGADWCLLGEGSWNKPGTDDLNVTWGSNNLLEAVAYYFLYCKNLNHYTIFDRDAKKIIDIRGSQLFERVVQR